MHYIEQFASQGRHVLHNVPPGGRSAADVAKILDWAKAAQMRIFEKLRKSQARAVCQALELRKYREGQVVFAQGTRGAQYYMMAHGCVDVYFSEDGGIKGGGTAAEITKRSKRIHSIGQGSCFGEVALLRPDEIRSASAIASTICEIWVLGKREFMR